jgi:hypothetical protein
LNPLRLNIGPPRRRRRGGLHTAMPKSSLPVVDQADHSPVGFVIEFAGLAK